MRLDSSYKIGSGHLMRCSLLADRLKIKGHSVTFLCKNLPGNMSFLIKEKGHKVHQLNSRRLSEEIKEVSVFLRQYAPVDLLVIDHYELDEKWESVMRPYVQKIMVIDDIANRKHDCDILLDQNYYKDMTERYRGLVPVTSKILVGPDYALLRDEFQLLKPARAKEISKVKNILVNFGGMDPMHYCLTFLNLLWGHYRQFESYSFIFILGEKNADFEKSKLFAKKLPNCKIISSTDSMAKLMTASDLCIGSSGSTALERACLGVASFVAVSASNQEKVAQDGHGFYHHVLNMESDELANEILYLISDTAYLNRLSKNAFELLKNASVDNLVAYL